MNPIKLKGKTLHQAMPNIGTNIKLGCKGGCNFIYCGKVPQPIDIHNIDAEYIERQERAIENSKEQVDRLIRQISELEAKIRKATEEVYRKQNQLKNRKHFLKRKIVDVYKSETERNTYIVLLEGSDRGDYWTTEECEKGIAHNEQENEDE